MMLRYAAMVVLLIAVAAAVASADDVAVDAGRRTSDLTVYSDTGNISQLALYLYKAEVYDAWAPAGWTVSIVPTETYVTITWTADTCADDILPGSSLAGFGIDVRKRTKGTWATYYSDCYPGHEGQSGVITIRK